MAFLDGKGPAVRWFPRPMRPWVNTFFARRGWPAPYDAELNKIPRRDRGRGQRQRRGSRRVPASAESPAPLTAAQVGVRGARRTGRGVSR
jgi:hypothetical protein